MNFKITILLIIALLSVSTSPLIGRYLDSVPAVSISFWRMFIGSLLIWIYSYFKRQGRVKNKKNYNRIIIAGILLGIHFALFFGSIKLTLIANATFLGTLAPLITLIIEMTFLKRHFNPKIILGLTLSFLGAIIILGNDFDLSAQYTIGNLLAIACSICLAISFLIAEKVRKEETTIVYTRLLYLSASITLFFIAIVMNVDIIGFNYNDYMWLIFLGIVPTIIGHNSLYYAVRYVSPTIASAFPLGEPIIATIFAYFIFSEVIGFGILLGGVVTFIGLVLISINKNN